MPLECLFFRIQQKATDDRDKSADNEKQVFATQDPNPLFWNQVQPRAVHRDRATERYWNKNKPAKNRRRKNKNQSDHTMVDAVEAVADIPGQEWHHGGS